MTGRTLRGGALALGLALSGIAISGIVAGAMAAGPQVPIGPDGQPDRQQGLPVAAALAAVPADNPQTPAKVALGRALFFEPRLSADGRVACASCHQPGRAFTDGRATAVGVRGLVGQRNAPSILNTAFAKTLFWDGRVTTLEAQAALPITNPSEMGAASLEAATAKIAGDAKYREAFAAVFGRAPNGSDLTAALAAYERSELAFASAFDAFAAGDTAAMSPAAQRGLATFRGKGHCAACHALNTPGGDGALFMDQRFHNIGAGLAPAGVTALACRTQARLTSGTVIAVDQAAIASELSALGAFLVTKDPDDIAAFKTPSLRNVAVTGPYFHDGSARTLWDVVDHYNRGGRANPWLDPAIRPLKLTEAEIDDLVAFLGSLTSAPFRGVGERELARQRQIANVARPNRDLLRAFSPAPARGDPAAACPQIAPRSTTVAMAGGR
jgi:cytochrome c peroxidase